MIEMCAGEKIKLVGRSLDLRLEVYEFEGSQNVVLSVLSGEAQKLLCAVVVTTHRHSRGTVPRSVLPTSEQLQLHNGRVHPP